MPQAALNGGSCIRPPSESCHFHTPVLLIPGSFLEEDVLLQGCPTIRQHTGEHHREGRQLCHTKPRLRSIVNLLCTISRTLSIPLVLPQPGQQGEGDVRCPGPLRQVVWAAHASVLSPRLPPPLTFASSSTRESCARCPLFPSQSPSTTGHHATASQPIQKLGWAQVRWPLSLSFSHERPRQPALHHMMQAASTISHCCSVTLCFTLFGTSGDKNEDM